MFRGCSFLSGLGMPHTIADTRHLDTDVQSINGIIFLHGRRIGYAREGDTMHGAITTRFFEKVCDATGGDTTTAVHCLSDIARPLRLTDAQIWDAVDDLLSEGLLEPALVSGVQVRLTATGAQRCIEHQRRGVD